MALRAIALQSGAGRRSHGDRGNEDKAAVSAAQIGYDLKVPGEMAFFSWPSRGRTRDDTADEATISASVDALAAFLHQLSERSGAERVHLFVISFPRSTVGMQLAPLRGAASRSGAELDMTLRPADTPPCSAQCRSSSEMQESDISGVSVTVMRSKVFIG